MATNVNNPQGLVYTRNVEGSVISGGVGQYCHLSADSTALFRGDPVVSGTQDNAAASSSAVAGVPDGTPSVIASGTVTTGAIRGAVEGIFPTLTNLSLQYGAASTNYLLSVRDDPRALFAIQSNGTSAQADVGDRAGITSGSGSTTTGLSAYVLTESTADGNATDVLRIIRMLPVVNNNFLVANTVYEVLINVHELTLTTSE